ncbi:MAG: type IVB secretion system apparatus protein IcmL/DotI [Pseudomonadota bacterium]
MTESKPVAKENPRNIRPAGGKSPIKVPTESADIEMMRAVGSVIVRNEFYRDGYRSILKIAVIEAMVIVALVGAMYFIIEVHQPENRYFATTEDGRLIPMVALSEPNLSIPALMSWSAQATTEVMTFGFNDYKRRLQEASRNFTRVGWVGFTNALEKSRIIEMVETNQQVVSAVPASAPILVNEGLVGGRYQWQVQVPMVITYQAGAAVRVDKMIVNLTVVRVPKLESSNGVGIEQWIAQ